MPPRYRSTEVEVGDSNVSGERVAPIQVGRLNLRLCWRATRAKAARRSACAGWSSAGPTTSSCSTPSTSRRCCIARGNEILAGYLREPARPAAPARRGAGGAPVAARPRRRRRDRRLPAAGGGQPQRAAVRAAAAAPRCCTRRTSTTSCLSLAGRPRDLPREAAAGRRSRPYLHDDPQRLLPAADGRPAPVAVDGDGADRDPDRAAGPQVRRPRGDHPPTSSCSATRSSCSRSRRRLPGEALRARFPTQVKIGPVERIRDLVNLQLPGVDDAAAAGGAAPDPVPRRLHLLRARNAQQRAVEAARERRAGWRCTSPATSRASSSSSGPSG